ncbi:NtrZ family periplasmic regulatory protein [uncultured Brevundimonas sp.]|jgi:hypothetical protein|uniref:NtrZ family periplasmic regulatory protein n=1 Tax=uncultured Brevundimonas sp. TaxID=213418 RepID=UPI0025F92F68|nr:hypothetical protein [uncultured Brevundimonas sp.]
MRVGGLSISALSLAVLLSAGGTAHAQSTSRAQTLTLSEAANAQRAAPSQRRGLRLNDRGRWGLDFNLNQPVGREQDWSDVEAGAYYRLNDRLRVGAAAGLAAPETDPARAPETANRTQPRVRLESIFKF